MAEDDIVKGVSKFIRNIRTNIFSDAQREQLSKAYAKEAAAVIKARTRRGYGLDADGDSLSNLKELDPDYIERRRFMRLHGSTTPGKSNLTARGPLLNSITAKLSQYPHWAVAMPGDHYSGETNRQLARYLSRERPFLFLSSNEQIKLGQTHLQRFNALVRRST